jgi:uncharacterized protein (DUF362 family)
MSPMPAISSRVGVARLSAREPYADGDRIRDVVREAVSAGSADGRGALSDVVHAGATVLVKPNWVFHENQGGHGTTCLVTHPRFLTAVVAEVAAARPRRIIVGDAPLQGCRWDGVVPAALVSALQGAAAPVPLDVVDFRRTILSSGTLANGVQREMRAEDRYVIFDLGRDSLLEPLSRPGARFRVTMYDPDRLAQEHRAGRHRYVLCREAFEADVVLSLPKLKTHRKSGITGALKNLVGLNGDKDFLPHHRRGGSALGGDCYPGWAPLKALTERFLDAANRRIGDPSSVTWSRWAWRTLRVHRRLHGDPEIEGGWHGNDTTWRMTLDLNRIALYGRADGSMADAPQRTLWSLTDALVAGDGEGPLAPAPLALGVVTCAASAAAADAVHAALLRLDGERIPLVHGAWQPFRWPLAPPDAPHAMLGDRCLALDEVAETLGVDARPPSGWAVVARGSAPR